MKDVECHHETKDTAHFCLSQAGRTGAKRSDPMNCYFLFSVTLESRPLKKGWTSGELSLDSCSGMSVPDERPRFFDKRVWVVWNSKPSEKLYSVDVKGFTK